MRRIAVINYKGGTGKTCTVVNVAHCLARLGNKVLLIDTDTQGSASYHFGIEAEKTLYDVLIKKQSLEDVKVTCRENLDIICANEHLFPAELALGKMEKKEFILTSVLDKIDDYDYVLLDCAPSMSVLNQNILLAADEILLPVSMEYLALVGIKQLLKNIKLLNKLFDREISISKVVPTFYDKRNKKSNDILNSLKRVFPGVISSPIRSSVLLSEASGIKSSIFEFAPNSKGAQDYINLTKEVISNGKKT